MGVDNKDFAGAIRVLYDSFVEIIKEDFIMKKYKVAILAQRALWAGK